MTDQKAVMISTRELISDCAFRPMRSVERLPDEIPGDAYAHVLGLYLGDGTIADPGREGRYRRLVIYCDSRQTECILACFESLRRVLPGVSMTTHKVRDSNCVQVISTSPIWLQLLPQHGDGRKHERRIALEEWQWRIVARFPWDFLRGLLHSDGCRSINRVKTTLPSGRKAVYEYPRWYFVNASEDILRIFRLACELVGIQCTRSRERMITVSKRKYVALLDEHVGLKA